MIANDARRTREAALLLHGLKPATQRRALDGLRTHEAERLQPLLDELVRLGVSPALAHQLQALGTPAACAARELPALERVATLTATDVERVLRDCAPVTIAHLLLAREWPWQQQLLDCMPELRRAQVLRHMRADSSSLAPAVLTWL